MEAATTNERFLEALEQILIFVDILTQAKPRMGWKEVKADSP
jgi:hypothetical protein